MKNNQNTPYERLGKKKPVILSGGIKCLRKCIEVSPARINAGKSIIVRNSPMVVRDAHTVISSSNLLTGR